MGGNNAAGGLLNAMRDLSDTRPVLVLGATGAQGGAVLRSLLLAGVPARALVRDPSKAQTLAELGATSAIGDFEDSASLFAACHGVRAVFSVQNAPFADPDSERREGRNIVAAASAANVPHLIHSSVSGTGAYHRSVPQWGTGRWEENYWESKAYVEDTVRDAGFPYYTILRPAFMMENFTPPKSAGMFPDLTNNQLVTAFLPETRVALVSASDIGRAATAAVLDPERYHMAEVELAGDSCTMAEIASTLTRVTGRPVAAISLPAADVVARGQYSGWVSTQEWLNVAGYPATPDGAHKYSIATISFEEWARGAVAVSTGRQ